MSRFGDGLAGGPDLRRAAEEATAAALARLAGQVPDLLCVFVSGGEPDEQAAGGARARRAGRVPDLLCVFVSGGEPDEQAAAAERAAALGGARATLGCSAGGVLAGGRGLEGEGAVSVFAAVLPGVELRTFHLEVLRADAGAAVVGLPETQDGDVAVLLTDPYSFPADGFMTQVNRAMPGIPVVGGMASGLGGPGSTRLHLDGRSVDRGAVGLLLRGAGVTALVSQGCRPVGPPMTVTAAAGNVLRGLAGTPAIAKVQQVLADLPPEEQALASAGLHLGIAADEYAEDQDFLVRGLLGSEPETGGLVVGDLVSVGQTVRLQVRDADTADAGLRMLLAGHRATSDAADGGGALLFSCNGRGAHLFGAAHGGADHDPGVVRDVLGAAGVGGFFADGELGPVGGRNHLHGFTASMLVFPA